MADESNYSPSSYTHGTVRGIGGIQMPALVATDNAGRAWQVFAPTEQAADRDGVYVGSHVERDGKVSETRIFYTIEAFEQVLKSAQDALTQAQEQRDYNQKHRSA